MRLLRIASSVATLLLLLTLSGCRASKLKTADAQMQRGEYYEAARTYRTVYNSLTRPAQRPLRGEVAFKMATAHRMLGQHAKAAAAYRNALRYGQPDSLTRLLMAQSLHASGSYTEAIRAYTDVLDSFPTSQAAAIGLSGASNAQQHRSHPTTRYIVRPAKSLNTTRSDYAPAFNGNILYFTTTDRRVSGTANSPVTGAKPADIWSTRPDESGAWTRPEPAEGDLNTTMDEGAICFSHDGRTMYLTRSISSPTAPDRVAIFTSQRSDAQWSEPRLLDIFPDTTAQYAHPSVSPSGRWLYFTSDLRGGYGDLDIWRIALDRDGARPENLGPEINTPMRDMFPTVVDDSTFVFSSDGHPGYGGLDLFTATLSPYGHWSVANMGTPLNSYADDFGMAFAPDTPTPQGFFSSSRSDARGYDHLFSFELPALRVSVAGIVTDLEGDPLPGATVRMVGDDGTNRRAVTRDDGSYDFPASPAVSYVMLATAADHLNARQQFTADTTREDALYEVDFALATLGRPNIVDNIFYDYDRATLRPESQQALDGLVAMMNDNPHITIRMASHTDRHGSEAYNMRLSERRALAVVDYLQQAGIPADRLSYRGYGKTVPMRVTQALARAYPEFEPGTLLNEDFVKALDDDEMRDRADQINRRTEFTIIDTDYGLH